MSKKKKRRLAPATTGPRSPRLRAPELEEVMQQAEDMIDQGRPWAIPDLLEPLLETYPRQAELHYYLAYAQALLGDTWGAMSTYERAVELGSDVRYWLPLASLYLRTGLHAHAVRAFRRVLKHGVAGSFEADAREAVVEIEQEIAAVARTLNLPDRQVEDGLYHMERGNRALGNHDLSDSIAASRQAIKLLRDWPPPHNNLSLALFFDGQPDEAMAEANHVLVQDPDNVQALGNRIRFLTAVGQEAEARATWEHLSTLASSEFSERIKMAEAATMLDEDESVYQLLKPLEQAGEDGPYGLTLHAQHMLAVAAANTKRPEALERMEALPQEMAGVKGALAALRAGRPGPGWAQRFPYFHSTSLVSRQTILELSELSRNVDNASPERLRTRMDRFLARYPQLIRATEKLIWEEDIPDLGVTILFAIGTPEAYAVLRRFVLSQVGSDEERLQALSHLMSEGQIEPGATLRLWKEGEWREVQVNLQTASSDYDDLQPPPSPEAVHLLDEGRQAFEQGDLDRTEALLRRLLELEPNNRDAYNNLGVIYGRRGDHEQAKAMYRAALEVDPLYVSARGNLVLYLLDEGDVDGARETLAPLMNLQRMRPQEMAFYSYVQARIQLYEDEYDAARQLIETALQVYPGYKLAEDLLSDIDLQEQAQVDYHAYMKRQYKHWAAARARLQARLTLAAPPLSEVLSNYPKDVLTAVARIALPWGGWSALRKAPLVDELAQGLTDPDTLAGIVADLTDDERAALRMVLEHGGDVPWSEFDARYGNDAKESPYWQYHEPETPMGRLRLRMLLAETVVGGDLRVAVPVELRPLLRELLY